MLANTTSALTILSPNFRYFLDVNYEKNMFQILDPNPHPSLNFLGAHNQSPRDAKSSANHLAAGILGFPLLLGHVVSRDASQSLHTSTLGHKQVGEQATWHAGNSPGHVCPILTQADIVMEN